MGERVDRIHRGQDSEGGGRLERIRRFIFQPTDPAPEVRADAKPPLEWFPGAVQALITRMMVGRYPLLLRMVRRTQGRPKERQGEEG